MAHGHGAVSSESRCGRRSAGARWGRARERRSSRRRSSLLGMMTKMPVAGVVWQNLHYLLGLRAARLRGLLRRDARAHAVDADERPEDDDSSALAAEFIAAIMRRFGLADRWAFRALHDDGRCFGMSEQQLERLYGSADAADQPPRRHPAAAGADAPPAGSSTSRPTRSSSSSSCATASRRRSTSSSPTAPSSPSPRTGASPTAACRCRTASASCRPASRWCSTSGPTARRSRPTSSRRSATGARTGATSPSRASATPGASTTSSSSTSTCRRAPARRFELALSSCDDARSARCSRERGWRVRDGLEVSRGIDRYRDYIGASRGEFTVAKDQNVRLRTGWFSDRSATYLASGRPVVTQDTGFGIALPTGEGLLRLRLARRGARRRSRRSTPTTRATPARRARSARSTSATRRCCGRCSSSSASPGASPRAARGRPPCFPPEMVLEPVSRRPTALPRETVEAAQRQPTSRHRGRAGAGRRAAPASSSSPTTASSFTRLCLESVLANTGRARLRADRRRQRLRATAPRPT